MAVQYFGYQSNLDAPAGISWNSGDTNFTFHNNNTNFACTSPSGGPFDVKELRVYSYGAASGDHFRMAIYTLAGVLVAQGNGQISPYDQGSTSTGTAAWCGHIGAANITQSSQVQSSTNYYIILNEESTGIAEAYVSLTDGTQYASGTTYTADGFPANLTLPLSQDAPMKFCVVCGVEAGTSTTPVTGTPADEMGIYITVAAQG